MLRSSFGKIMLIAAGALSLLAQGILLIPTTLGFLLRFRNSDKSSFTSGGSGALLFGLAVLLFATIIFQSAKDRQRWRSNGILLATQVFAALGIYFLLDGFAPGERGAGFVLSSLITTVTTYGIF